MESQSQAQGDGADQPFVAPENDKSDVGITPGWEWVGEFVQPRDVVSANAVTQHPITLFGEIRGPLTIVTNGWFLLALDGDLGYPVANEMQGPMLRNALRRAPADTPTRAVPLDLLRQALGIPSEPHTRCERCRGSRRATCPCRRIDDALTFRPPCAVCDGAGITTCGDCVVLSEPDIDPIQLGIAPFNRAVIAPVLRRLAGTHAMWRHAKHDEPAVLRADGWMLLLMPLKNPIPTAPSFRPLEVAA